MNPEYEKPLEAQTDRALKQLPDLQAPRTLGPRVMAAIARQAELPWYRRAWQTWPAGLRTASLAVLVAFFGGLCLLAYDATHSAVFVQLTQNLGRWFSSFSFVGNTLSALAQSVALTVQHLGPMFIAACIGIMAAACLSCLGLGAAFMRLTYTNARH
jgi:hypothetical protein